MQLLLGATLIDGTGAAPVPDAAVLINDGRISAVGPRQTVSRPANADVIDLSGLPPGPGARRSYARRAGQVFVPGSSGRGGVSAWVLPGPRAARRSARAGEAITVRARLAGYISAGPASPA